MINPDLALRLVREARVISYDVETTGLGPESLVCGYVIADRSQSIYVPVRHEAGGNIPCAEDFESELNHAFEDRTRHGYRTVGHNLAFDLFQSWKHGVIVGGQLEDTEINEGLIDDISLMYNLGAVANRYGVTPKEGATLYAELARRFGGVPDRKQMGNYWRMPGDHPLTVEYACGDGITTLEIWERQQPLLDEHDLRRVWQMECDLIRHLARMKQRGMKVASPERCAEIKIGIERGIEEAKAQFPKGFKASSGKDLIALYLANDYTEDQFARTAPSAKHPKGQPSFTEKWLETNEIGRELLKIRKLEKALGSFFKPLAETYNVEGRVHATLNQSKNDDSGAVGGRLSCSDPNLQAFPKRNKVVGKVVRQLLVADDGYLMGESDFSQQEPRLFAHYSEDANLLGGYLSNPPLDIHTVASQITGLHRDIAKRLGLGILTGMGHETLGMHMNWSIAEAKEGTELFLDRAFPGIRVFQKDAKKTMLQRGFVRTLLGRNAHVDDKRFAYKATSRIIQGSGADHTKLALLRACEYCESVNYDIEMLMTIHDSFIYQFLEGMDHLKDELVRILEETAQVLEIMVPIPVETHVGRDWAEASYGGK